MSFENHATAEDNDAPPQPKRHKSTAVTDLADVSSHGQMVTMAITTTITVFMMNGAACPTFAMEGTDLVQHLLDQIRRETGEDGALYCETSNSNDALDPADTLAGAGLSPPANRVFFIGADQFLTDVRALIALRDHFPQIRSLWAELHKVTDPEELELQTSQCPDVVTVREGRIVELHLDLNNRRKAGLMEGIPDFTMMEGIPDFSMFTALVCIEIVGFFGSNSINFSGKRRAIRCPVVVPPDFRDFHRNYS
jgi:hypothetical protein